MANPITHKDIAEEGFIKDHAQKEFQELAQTIPMVEAAIVKFAGTLNASLKSVKFDNLDDFKKYNEIIKQTTQLEELDTKVKKVKIELTNEQIAASQIDRSNKKDLIDKLKAEIVLQNESIGTLQRLEAQNTKLRLERKALNSETDTGKKRLVEINAELDKNNKYIKENSDQLKQQKLNVGNYTASIKEAFEGTGEFGESINKLMGIVTNISSKLEILVEHIIGKTAAEKATAAASEEATVALEAETIATEEATVATEGFTAALATNPFVLAAIAIAALAKVGYDNATATQQQRDEWDAAKESAEAYGKSLDLLGVDSERLAKNIHQIVLEEFKLQDEEIGNLVKRQELRTEAAKSREASMQEGTTAMRKIELLSQYVDKVKESGRIEVEEAKKNAELKQRIVDDYGKYASREQKKAAEEAKAAASSAEAALASESLKVEKKILQLEDKLREDKIKMRQDAERDELSAIDTYSDVKATHIKKQLDKDLKLNDLETKQKIENLKSQQKALGEINETNEYEARKNDAQSAEFQKEIEALEKLGNAKDVELKRAAHKELVALELAYEKTILDMHKMFVSDVIKLDDDIDKLHHENEKQRRSNEISNGDFQLELQQRIIEDLQKQQEEKLKIDKHARLLSVQDLKDNFNKIEQLEKEHFERTKESINADADFEKSSAKRSLDEEISAIHDKYEAIRKAQYEAAKADGKGDIYDSTPADNEEEAEIRKAKERNLQEEIQINLKAQNELNKNDEDYLKKKIALEQQEADLTKKFNERQKELLKERVKQSSETVEQITNGIKEGLDKRAQIEEKADQEEIDLAARTIDVQAKLAAGGMENSLAEAQAAHTQAEEKKLQDAKKAAKTQETITIIETFEKTLSAALESGKPFFEAFGEASLSSGMVTAAFAKLFSGFATGVENLEGPGTETSDSILARLSKGESVATAKATKQNPGLVTAMNNGTVSEYFDNLYLPNYNSSNSSVPVFMEMAHDEKLAMMMDKKFQSLEKAIVSRPIQQVNLGKLGEWTEDIISENNRIRINHKRDTGGNSLRLRG